MCPEGKGTVCEGDLCHGDGGRTDGNGCRDIPGKLRIALGRCPAKPAGCLADPHHQLPPGDPLGGEGLHRKIPVGDLLRHQLQSAFPADHGSQSMQGVGPAGQPRQPGCHVPVQQRQPVVGGELQCVGADPLRLFRQEDTHLLPQAGIVHSVQSQRVPGGDAPRLQIHQGRPQHGSAGSAGVQHLAVVDAAGKLHAQHRRAAAAGKDFRPIRQQDQMFQHIKISFVISNSHLSLCFKYLICRGRRPRRPAAFLTDTVVLRRDVRGPSPTLRCL